MPFQIGKLQTQADEQEKTLLEQEEEVRYWKMSLTPIFGICIYSLFFLDRSTARSERMRS